jgi:hypothetical protein
MFGWLKRFHPRWCKRCRSIHQPPDPNFEDRLYAKLAQQIADEIDREILAELEKEYSEKK